MFFCETLGLDSIVPIVQHMVEGGLLLDGRKPWRGIEMKGGINNYVKDSLLTRMAQS